MKDIEYIVVGILIVTVFLISLVEVNRKNSKRLNEYKKNINNYILDHGKSKLSKHEV